MYSGLPITKQLFVCLNHPLIKYEAFQILIVLYTVRVRIEEWTIRIEMKTIRIETKPIQIEYWFVRSVAPVTTG